MDGRRYSSYFIIHSWSMKITVEKLTDSSIMRRACECTTDKESKASLNRMYDCEHSPIRTQVFWVEMKDIPTFVSVHLARHKIGVEHFVKSNRLDRGWLASADRYTPVRHGMFIDAQALINMSRKRLCKQASEETQDVMLKIKIAVAEIDPALAKYMVPECVYRGKCHELRSCKK